DAQEAAQAAESVRDQLAKVKPQAAGAIATALEAFDKKIEAAFTPASTPGPARGAAGVGFSTPFQPTAGQGQAPAGRGGRGGGIAVGAGSTLNAPATALAAVMNSLQSADVQPTASQVTAIETALANARAAIGRWNTLKTTELTGLNAQLKGAGLPAIELEGR